MKRLLLVVLLAGLSPSLGAEIKCSGTPCADSSGGVTSPVTVDPLSFTGVVSFDNTANTPATFSDGIIDSTLTATRCTFAGTAGRLSGDADCTFATDTLTATKLIGTTSVASASVNVGTPTTADANADSLFGASATTKKALVIQAKATPTQPPFEVQQSNGTPWFTVTTDGSVIIDQRTAATFTRMLNVKYQGTEQMSVDNGGLIYTRVGANLGQGGVVTDASGNIVALGNITSDHDIGGGTSPTVEAGGGPCGTSAPSIAGKDKWFKVTVGSVAATSCTVTFGQTYATAPACVCSTSASQTNCHPSTSTTAVTLTSTAFTPGEVLHVACGGF